MRSDPVPNGSRRVKPVIFEKLDGVAPSGFQRALALNPSAGPRFASLRLHRCLSQHAIRSIQAPNNRLQGAPGCPRCLVILVRCAPGAPESGSLGPHLADHG